MGNLLDFVALSYYTEDRKYVENSTPEGKLWKKI
jgi:hypothetical protein